jgi:hypothetical protein
MMMILKMNNFHFLIQYIFNFYSKYIYFFNMVIVIEILFLIIFRKNILYNVSSQIYVFLWRFLKFSILEMNLSLRIVRDVARFWSIQIYFHIIMFFSIKWRYVIIDVFFGNDKYIIQIQKFMEIDVLEGLGMMRFIFFFQIKKYIYN